MVRGRDARQPASIGHRGEQADAQRIEPIAERAMAVEEPRVRVQVDSVHGSADAGQTLLRSAGVSRSMQPEGAGDRSDGDRVLVLNPASGDGDHVDEVVDLGDEHGFDVRKTAEPGDAMRFARECAPDAGLIAAAGGDGTVNAVVNGLVAADALETTTVAVVPAGTGNNFATNVGVRGIDHAFTVIEDGRRRSIDIATANDRVFINSCVGGLTAEASSETSAASKAELGVLAYVKNTLETVSGFDSLPLRVQTVSGSNGVRTRAWEGEAMFVLVGNCRRFTGARTAQANVEDGLLEVTIVADASATDLLRDAALEGLFDRESDHIVQRRTPSLVIESRRDAIEYSLDGEMLEAETLSLETGPRSLSIAVGEGYQPDPDGGGHP